MLPPRFLILALAATTAACAPSPLYIGHVRPALAPGAVPRNARGEPVLSASPHAITSPVARSTADSAIIYWPDLAYPQRTATLSPP